MTSKGYPGGPGLGDPETERAVEAVAALTPGSSHRLCPCGHASWNAANVCAACGHTLHPALCGPLRRGDAVAVNAVRYAGKRSA